MAALRELMHIVTPAVNSILRKSSIKFVNPVTLPHHSIWPTLSPFARLRTDASGRQSAKPFPKPPPHQHTVTDTSTEEDSAIEEVISKVNSQIDDKSHGRLFAIVHLFNRQWKITPEDVLVLEGYWPPKVGDVIRLEQVLLVGSADFSLVGMPLLRPDLVNIQATVIEKRLSHTKTNFRKKRRKQYQRINFYRYQHTMIRINSITLTSRLNEKMDIEGLEGRVF